MISKNPIREEGVKVVSRQNPPGYFN